MTIKYYAFIENNIIIGTGQCRVISESIISAEIAEDVYNNIEKFIWDSDAQLVVLNPDYEAEQVLRLKEQLNVENTAKAKEAVENGYVSYRGAEFETNTQTVGDLTATERMMEKYGIESYDWLSRDDKTVTLTLVDFGVLASLIAGYKAHIWSEEYLSFKQQIEEATTLEELEAIVIDYDEPVATNEEEIESPAD